MQTIVYTKLHLGYIIELLILCKIAISYYAMELAVHEIFRTTHFNRHITYSKKFNVIHCTSLPTFKCDPLSLQDSSFPRWRFFKDRYCKCRLIPKSQILPYFLDSIFHWTKFKRIYLPDNCWVHFNNYPSKNVSSIYAWLIFYFTRKLL